MSERGFTYLGLLIAIALAGVALAAVGTVASIETKREKEIELLAIGGEMRRAIASYYEASPGAKQFPRSLEELVLDRRFPAVRRHLRRVYVDPFTGNSEWGLVKVPGDRIVGVYSLAQGKPLKVGNFARVEAGFANAAGYADWRFVYAPGAAER